MALKDNIQRIIDKYGSTLTITPVLTTSDYRGDITETLSSDVVTTKGVMDGFILQQLNIQRYGNFQDTDPILIVGWGETINKGDRVSFKGKEFNVIEIEDFYLSDENLAIQCVLKERS
jgi:hypothetical protein